MTKRAFACVLLAVASIVATPSDAAAGLWDVLEQLSGPGEFDGNQVLTGKVSCWEDGVLKVTKAMLEPDLNDPCLYFEIRQLHVDPKGPYQAVNATISAAGLSIQLHRSIEVGASFGVAVFTTTVAGKDYQVVNPVLAPRLVFKPLRVLLPRWKNNPRLGFLQMHYRPTVRFGNIDGADFGAPADTFSSGTELLAKSGSWIVIDVLEALRGH
jgi:hypothetical protein